MEWTVEEIPVLPDRPNESSPAKKRKLKQHDLTNPQEISNIIYQNAQYFYTDDGIVVLLDTEATVYFYGLMLLSVLHGEVEILGHKIDKNCASSKVYSPRGSAHLYIKNTTTAHINTRKFLMSLGIKSHVKPFTNSAIILCKKLDDPIISFIEKYLPQKVFPKPHDTNLPSVKFDTKGSAVIKIHPKWDAIIDNFVTTTKLIICGGKGVGKSTFLRYAINKLLLKFKQVRVIDLDPGQSEFTLPGCISIVTIDEPVFGVNFTHLRTPNRSILSNINISHDPKKYLSNVESLVNVDLDQVPTLVNYMGYNHGIGVNILSAVIALVAPTDVLQINSIDVKKNFDRRLTGKVVKANAKFLLFNVPPVMQYKYIEIDSVCDGRGGWTAEPRQLREMCVLSHLALIADDNSIFNSKLPLYKVDMSNIVICDLYGQEIHPAAVNANLVALCTLEGKDVFHCCGWGIVRGVDTVLNILVLLTVEKIQVLEKVTHIVLSSVTLPPSVYMTPDEIIGEMPYVMEGSLVDFGQITKRSQLPAKK